MPKLTIDNIEVTVDEGTNVLDAARKADIVVPHFCYHEALGAVGSCRLCAMMFKEGPVKGLQMGCMIKAEDGMVVSTTDPQATDLRKHVIEWLMMDHPHDCPVCDEGGECQLQEMTVAGGHGLRRYRGKKKTFPVQDLGPFVKQEMNRCITCYRCVRTYRDYCGGTDYGVLGSRNRVFFGRIHDGPLESPFSGNIIDVCPTGVLTSKPFRFKTRLWDLQEAPSLCPHCSLGCATVPGGRYREIQRVRAGINRKVNGFFICDRGRFGYDYVNHPERPRQPRVNGSTVSLEHSIQIAREKIAAFIKDNGPGSVAFLGSSRVTVEAQALLKEWAEQLGVEQIVFEAHQERDRAARILAAKVGHRSRNLEDIHHSDLIVLVGIDPLAEAPLLALALRQAALNGCQIAVIDPRPIKLPCNFKHLPLPVNHFTSCMEVLSGQGSEALSEHAHIFISSLGKDLTTSERPILIGGTTLLNGDGIDALCSAASYLSTPTREVGVFSVLTGPNSFGGAVLSGDGPYFGDLLNAIFEEQVKALVCLASDPFSDAMEPSRAQNALGHLDLLVSIDFSPTLASRRADIFIPARAFPEMSGSMVNNEGRLQAFHPVIDPGIPIRETGNGGHPPREFFNVAPGSTPQADWWILAKMLNRSTDLTELRQGIAAKNPSFLALETVSPESEGVKINVIERVIAGAPSQCFQPQTENLTVMAIPDPVGSDWLAHLSAPWRSIVPSPYILLHSDLAHSLGLSDGDQIRLTTYLGHCSVRVRIHPNMVKDQVLAPQLWGTVLEGLAPGQTIECRLDKEIKA